MKFEWRDESTQSRVVWVYESVDLCACVWTERGVVWWDVSGPGGRGTKASGSVSERVFGDGLPLRITTSMRLAETWMDGYRRRGRDMKGAL